MNPLQPSEIKYSFTSKQLRDYIMKDRTNILKTLGCKGGVEDCPGMPAYEDWKPFFADHYSEIKDIFSQERMPVLDKGNTGVGDNDDVYDVSESTEEPVAPEEPEEPVTPEAPKEPVTPEAPKEPVTPEEPETSKIREEPEVYEMTGNDDDDEDLKELEDEEMYEEPSSDEEPTGVDDESVFELSKYNKKGYGKCEVDSYFIKNPGSALKKCPPNMTCVKNPNGTGKRCILKVNSRLRKRPTKKIKPQPISEKRSAYDKIFKSKPKSI